MSVNIIVKTDTDLEALEFLDIKYLNMAIVFNNPISRTGFSTNASELIIDNPLQSYVNLTYYTRKRLDRLDINLYMSLSGKHFAFPNLTEINYIKISSSYLLNKRIFPCLTKIKRLVIDGNFTYCPDSIDYFIGYDISTIIFKNYGYKYIKLKRDTMEKISKDTTLIFEATQLDITEVQTIRLPKIIMCCNSIVNGSRNNSSVHPDIEFLS